MTVQLCARKHIFVLALMLIDSVDDRKAKKSRQRVTWTRPWLSRRRGSGSFHQLVRELSCKDENAFVNYFRMNQVRICIEIQ